MEVKNKIHVFSPAMLRLPLLADQDPSLLLQMRDRRLLEGTSPLHAQVTNQPLLITQTEDYFFSKNE